MADLWELWGSGDELYEGAYFEEEDDFGVQQVYAPEEILGRSAADFIGNVSELPPNVEVGTPPAQYRDMGIYGEDSGISFLNMSDQEFGDLYTPTAEDDYLSTLARIAQTVGQVASNQAMNPAFGGPRDRRDRERFAQAQSGSIPPGFGQSNEGATQTRFDGIQRRNLDTVYGQVRRTGIDVRPIVLSNIPKSPSVTIPSGNIGTTSGRRRAYSKLT